MDETNYRNPNTGTRGFSRPIVGLALLLSALSSLGCPGPGMPKVKTVVPIVETSQGVRRDLGISVVFVREDDSPAAGTGMDSRLATKINEIVVGYDRYHSTDPDRNLQEYYRGAVLFDLSDIVKEPSKVVDKATLSYRIHRSYVRDVSGESEPFPDRISCAQSLLLASEDWRQKITGEGYAVEPFAGDFFLRLPETPTVAPNFRIDLTKTVREWVAKPHENFGVIFTGRTEEATEPQNSACATRYGDFALEVRYTVFPK